MASLASTWQFIGIRFPSEVPDERAALSELKANAEPPKVMKEEIPSLELPFNRSLEDRDISGNQFRAALKCMPIIVNDGSPESFKDEWQWREGRGGSYSLRIDDDRALEVSLLDVRTTPASISHKRPQVYLITRGQLTEKEFRAPTCIDLETYYAGGNEITDEHRQMALQTRESAGRFIAWLQSQSCTSQEAIA